MRFKPFLVTVLLALLCFPTAQGRGLTFSDNFDDGNADGWIMPYYPSQSQGPGQWSVENGTLVQRWTGDGNRALVANLLLSSQVIETERSTAGYAGVVFWHQDNSWVAVNLNSGSGKIHVAEFMDGIISDYAYVYWNDAATWYDLKVDADTVSGELAVYLDGVYLFTYQASTPYRTGLSGVWSGNAVGYFDNFSVTGDSVAPVPEPSTVLLLGTGLVGLAGLRRRFKK